eukprot:TRINITY_DN76_c0_g1_i1.p1 TRINITY_DN76_c0_g1~~TRINITY_DN76_c0_g1_i1.p1  ORF type:complete len:221 (+),score=47.66 TRINITY_DN76_c0_g1_i1:55-717(+)
MSKSLFVWPWNSANLKYHQVIDTLVNESAPSAARCLYPDTCLVEKLSQDQLLPDPGVSLSFELPSGSHNLFFVSGTGIDSADPSRATYDRSKATIDLTGSTTAAVVIFVSNDEANVNQHIQPVYQTLYQKSLSTAPTFVVCLDDPTFAKGKEIQQKAIGALQDYGSDWVFKSVSSTPSVDEVKTLFSEIVSEAAAASANKNKAGAAKAPSGGKRRGCTLL